MSLDLLQFFAWSALLAVALAASVALGRRGLATTHVRDLLHVGAGVWVLGWRGWRSPIAPIVLTVSVALAMELMPFFARRNRLARAFYRSVSDEEERWSGLSIYTFSFAVFTTLGVLGHPVPAAAALWSLALGDGIGGAVGRRYGAACFSVPGGKRKSLEGSVTVAFFSMLGALVAGLWFGAPISLAMAVLVGVVAAVAEGLAPRATDNLMVPIAVYVLLRALGGGLT